MHKKQKQASAIEIVGDFHKALMIAGASVTQKVLKSIHNDPHEFKDKIADYIISKVSVSFHVSIQKLKTGTSKGSRVDALMVLYMLMRNCIDYGPKDIEQKIYKEISSIKKGMYMFKKLDTNIPQHRTIKEKYQAIEIDVIDYMRLEKERRALCVKS